MSYNQIQCKNLYSIGLGDGWNNAILNSQEEWDFIKAAMAFFFAQYHDKYFLGGSTNENRINRNIRFSHYLANYSGTMTLNTIM